MGQKITSAKDFYDYSRRIKTKYVNEKMAGVAEEIFNGMEKEASYGHTSYIHEFRHFDKKNSDLMVNAIMEHLKPLEKHGYMIDIDLILEYSYDLLWVEISWEQENNNLKEMISKARVKDKVIHLYTTKKEEDSSTKEDIKEDELDVAENTKDKGWFRWLRMK